MKEKLSKFLAWAKNGFNLTWKTCIIVFTVIIAAAFINAFGRDIKRKVFTRSDWYYSNTLSPCIRVKYYPQLNYYTTYNTIAEKESNFKMKWISDVPSRDIYAVYCDMDDKRGFVNIISGEIAIPAQYKKAWVFSEGLAAVVCDDDSLRFINSSNRVVMNKAFEYNTHLDYLFRKGHCIMGSPTPYEEDRILYGVIDRQGEWLLPQEYTSVYPVGLENYYIVKRSVGYTDYFGMTDSSLNWLYQPEYYDIDLSDDEQSVFVTGKDHIKRQLAFDGRVIRPFIVDEVFDLRYTKDGIVTTDEDGRRIPDVIISDRFARIRVSSYYGVINKKTGKIVIPPIYKDVRMISEGLFLCEVDRFAAKVVLDASGRVLDQSHVKQLTM